MNWKLSFCLTPSRGLAESIMHRLESERFSDAQISVIFPDKGALVLPGIGSYIAAGPIVASLGEVTRDDSEGIACGLIGLGMPGPTAERYQGRIEEGKFFLSVHAATCADAERAAKIFADMGAEEIFHPELDGPLAVSA